MSDYDACLLRENTGTTGVLETARAVADRLARHGEPHLVVGGIAVQEHGYPRTTIDVDIVVLDVLDAAELLTADLSGPFVRVAGVQDRLRDRRNGVMIDLLPAGGIAAAGCKVPFPTPQTVTEQPQIASVEQLISLKLDSWANAPFRRAKDRGDVVELILRKALPRGLRVDAAVQDFYNEIWDGLQAEARSEKL